MSDFFRFLHKFTISKNYHLLFSNQNSAEVSILSPSSTSIPVIPPLDLNASESIKFSDSAIPAATTSKDIDLPIISNEESETEATSQINQAHINVSSHTHDGITEIVMMASLDTEVGKFKGISIFKILFCDTSVISLVNL